MLKTDRVRILIDLPEREYRRLLHYAVLRGMTVNEAAAALTIAGLQIIDERDCDFMEKDKMTCTYPARITLSEKDNVYEVVFLDLPGCITYGETFEEARQQAAEALTGYLESVLSREIDFREPSAISGDVYEIEPDFMEGEK